MGWDTGEPGKTGAASPGGSERPFKTARGAARKPDQIGLVQHRHHRPPRGKDGIGVLGFDHLSQDMDHHVGGQVGVSRQWQHHDLRAPGVRQGARYGAEVRFRPGATLTRSGAAALAAIAVTRGSAHPAANRANSSTKS
ncbi:hypothetical protein [Mycobacterium tilburgii]|uniref:hypothetical protein n=1 Tax=Mycobacterium tilburgii TaxID=44467 RepID=UPI001182E7F2|nr:hypothetical protein [Mycobacterium tilburgii]